jgi:hypothetical protein
MAMRNFWINARIDGRKTRLTGGPQSKTGGLELTLYVRDQGVSVPAVKLEAWADTDGTLRIRADALLTPTGGDGARVIVIKTAR